MQGDSENETDLEITSETDLELKIQAQWVIQSWRWGKREVKNDCGVVPGWMNFDEIMGGGRHRAVNHTLKHGLTLGIIKSQPGKDLDQELLLLHSPLPSAHVGNLLVVWIAMLNQKPSDHV